MHFSAIHEPNHCSLLGVAHSDREWQTMLRLISSLNQSQGRLVNGYVSGHPNNTSLNTPRCRPKFQLLHGWAEIYENFLNAPRSLPIVTTQCDIQLQHASSLNHLCSGVSKKVDMPIVQNIRNRVCWFRKSQLKNYEPLSSTSAVAISKSLHLLFGRCSLHWFCLVLVAVIVRWFSRKSQAEFVGEEFKRSFRSVVN